jgi:hypothetical protein
VPADALSTVGTELESIDGLPLDDHAEVFTRIHAALAGALAGTDPRNPVDRPAER